MPRQGSRHVPGPLPKALRQAGPNAGMPAGLTTSRDLLIHDFLIQGVAKAIAARHRAIGPCRLPVRLEELALMGQRCAPCLNLLVSALDASSHRGGRELDPGHTRGGEQRLVLGTAVG